VIKAQDLNMIFICGPGHGGPAVVASPGASRVTPLPRPPVPSTRGASLVTQSPMLMGPRLTTLTSSSPA
jgi:hypothetical protein